MAQLPAPFRALIGLVATVVQDAPGLSDKTVELSVHAVSTALALSLRAQQQYAALTVRGDEMLAQWRGGPPDDAPEWASFDDDPPDTPPAAAPPPTLATDNKTPDKHTPNKKAPGKKAAARKAPATAAAASMATAKAGPAKKTTAKKVPVKRAPTKARAIKTAAAKAGRAAGPAVVKTVSAPRNGKLSAFDQTPDHLEASADWPDLPIATPDGSTA
jgi:hypothetical protein